MSADIRERLVIDPTLERKKIQVLGTRLVRGARDHDGDHRYELAVALRRNGKRWPKGDYHLRAFDSAGLMLVNTYVSENKSLDPETRHLESSFYAPDLERIELIFESSETSNVAEDWLDLQVSGNQAAEESLSIEVIGVRARAHPDFEYSNLVAIEVSGEVRPTYGLPLPQKLAVQISAFDEDENLLNSGQYDLSYGPASSRPMNHVLKVYSHEEPSVVRMEFFNP